MTPEPGGRIMLAPAADLMSETRIRPRTRDLADLAPPIVVAGTWQPLSAALIRAVDGLDERILKPATWYNENDRHAADWLTRLATAGLVPGGTIDRRSILEVEPQDLAGCRHCHFFAGIGGWAYALDLAQWPADREVWTASLPCQPFSSAGERRGHHDQRHLWPAFYHLVAECKPAAIFGEQVASADGREWLAGVRADLESLGYAVGAADLPAAGVGALYQETAAWQWLGWAVEHCPDPALADELRAFAEWAGHAIVVGAPHIRQRLFWVADRAEPGRRRQPRRDDRAHHRAAAQPRRLCDAGAVADTGCRGDAADLQARAGARAQWQSGGAGDAGAVADAECDGRGPDLARRRALGRAADFWAGAEWLSCLDGAARRAQPGVFPLAHGISGPMVVTCANCSAETKIADGLCLVWRTACRQRQKSAQILRPQVHGRGSGQGAADGDGWAISSAASVSSNVLHALWLDLAAASTPQGWRCDEQSPREYRDTVREVSCPRAQKAAQDFYLHSLRLDVCGKGSSKESEDLLCWMCGKMGPHQRTTTVGRRVGQLRGYGNAIVPQVAAWFVRGFLEIEP